MIEGQVGSFYKIQKIRGISYIECYLQNNLSSIFWWKINKNPRVAKSLIKGKLTATHHDKITSTKTTSENSKYKKSAASGPLATAKKFPSTTKNLYLVPRKKRIYCEAGMRGEH